MYLILDYVQKRHGVASRPWASSISLLKSRRYPQEIYNPPFTTQVLPL